MTSPRSLISSQLTAKVPFRVIWPERKALIAADDPGRGLNPMKDGHLVSRQSDFIMYSVEAEFLDKVVAMYGPCECWTALRVSPRWSSADDGVPATKIGAIVSGQTSVKAPERAAFEKYLPDDVFIISIHSLHGPTVAPDGQALVRFFAFFFLLFKYANTLHGDFRS